MYTDGFGCLCPSDYTGNVCQSKFSLKLVPGVSGPVFASLAGWKGKEGLTQIPVWAHVKKRTSDFSPDWLIRSVF